MASGNYFKMRDTRSSIYGNAKAEEIVIQIDKIISQTSKEHRGTREEKEEAIVNALIKYLEKEGPFWKLEEKIFKMEQRVDQMESRMNEILANKD